MTTGRREMAAQEAPTAATTSTTAAAVTAAAAAAPPAAMGRSSFARRLWFWPGHSAIAVPVRLYLGFVFVAACYHKILAPTSFALDVATYQLLPLPLVNLFALILPWIELVAALMLILGWRVRAAALLVSGMMAMFMIALGFALGKDLDMSCGCFASTGAAEDPISWKTIVRDATWLVLGIYVLLLDRRPYGLDRVLGSSCKGGGDAAEALPPEVSAQ
ncbi:MAG: MauE/DoxX family redox-associated membrane protein [Pseudomonadota bacterium]